MIHRIIQMLSLLNIFQRVKIRRERVKDHLNTIEIPLYSRNPKMRTKLNLRSQRRESKGN